MQVHYVDEIPKVIRNLKPPSIHVLDGTNSDRYFLSIPIFMPFECRLLWLASTLSSAWLAACWLRQLLAAVLDASKQTSTISQSLDSNTHGHVILQISLP